jgi:hypothetical protein
MHAGPNEVEHTSTLRERLWAARTGAKGAVHMDDLAADDMLAGGKRLARTLAGVCAARL